MNLSTMSVAEVKMFVISADPSGGECGILMFEYFRQVYRFGLANNANRNDKLWDSSY